MQKPLPATFLESHSFIHSLNKHSLIQSFIHSVTIAWVNVHLKYFMHILASVLFFSQHKYASTKIHGPHMHIYACTHTSAHANTCPHAHTHTCLSAQESFKMLTQGPGCWTPGKSKV